jgi:hypothetical protein
MGGVLGALIGRLSRWKDFHPQTQWNVNEIPEGVYIDLDANLTNIKAKRGKGGSSRPIHHCMSCNRMEPRSINQ